MNQSPGVQGVHRPGQLARPRNDLRDSEVMVGVLPPESVQGARIQVHHLTDRRIVRRPSIGGARAAAVQQLACASQVSICEGLPNRRLVQKHLLVGVERKLDGALGLLDITAIDG